MTNSLTELLHTSVHWRKTPENPYLFKAAFNGKEFYIRLNDFPQEPLCTLLIDTQEIQLHEFPKCWTLPRHRGE